MTTPKEISAFLTTLHAVGGTLGKRRDLEARYFAFHKRHGVHLRGKYRPR